MPPGGKKGRGGKATSSSKPIRIRKLKEVVFDEDARKEYLTGFSKRKKARELAVRSKAIDRDREEKNESRRDIRNERKEQAALNVRNANALYGDANDPLDGSKPSFDSDEDANDSDDSDSPVVPAGPSAAYETNDLITTVHIEPFSLSRSSSPVARPPPIGGYDNEGGSDEEGDKKKSMKSSRASGVEVAKKRVRNKPQARTKMTREDKKERAKGSKGKKASFLKGTVTKGKSNKGDR